MIPRPATPVWLVVAHGSRVSDVVVAHERICSAVAAQVGDEAVVRPAYLEITEPSITVAIDAAVADGSTTVVLVPYFLHVGRHILADLPQLLAAAADRHPEVEFALAEHLGFDDRLVEVAVDRARAAVPTDPAEDDR